MYICIRAHCGNMASMITTCSTECSTATDRQQVYGYMDGGLQTAAVRMHGVPLADRQTDIQTDV